MFLSDAHSTIMVKKRYYCTYFDSGYLSRGLALIKSLHQNCAPFELWVLCMDAKAFDELSRLNLPNVQLISREAFEAANPEVAATQLSRSRIEYYFTCTPALPFYLLQQHPTIDLITYLDADLYFYASPEPIFDELGGRSVAITPHRFTPRLKTHEENGLHNVGWLTFRRDQAGLACLAWWRERCIEWCFDRVEDDKFADQKYLDSFDHLFDGVVSIQHKGVNLALWNIGNYQISQSDGQVMVDEQPLIFYHFHGLKFLGWRFYHTGAAYFFAQLPRVAVEYIYRPYLKAAKFNQDQKLKGTKRQGAKSLLSALEDSMYYYYYLVKDTAKGNCLIV